MPIYLYQCPKCGRECDEFRRVDDRDDAPICHGPMERKITPVRGNVQANCHYVCPQTGEGVTSWRQRKNILAEHRLVDARDLNSPEVRRKRKEKRQEALEAARKAEVYGGTPPA